MCVCVSCFLFFFETGSPKCNWGWPWDYCVIYTGLKVIFLPQILRITVCYHSCLSVFFILFVLWVFAFVCVCVCVSAPRVPPRVCLELVEAKREWEGMRSLGMGVTGYCDLALQCWELNTGPPQEQQVSNCSLASELALCLSLYLKLEILSAFTSF